MTNIKMALFTATAALTITSASASAQDRSSGRKDQEQGVAEIPVCREKLGTIAVNEPRDRWWSRYNLPHPEALIKVFVQESGCFTIVDRGRGLQMRGVERDLADSGELQQGSNIGRGQVKAADYFVVPDLVGRNNRSGSRGIGGALGGLVGGRVGGLLGRVKVDKKEANVTLSLVNARTTEVEAVTEGYVRKSDVSFRGGGFGLFGATLGAVTGSGYENTEIGQVIVLAYLQAYSDLVNELGGLPVNASAAAPLAEGERDAGPAPANTSGFGISREAFNKIEPGMTVDQVSGIIGFEGDRRSFAGTTSSYIWQESQDSRERIIGMFDGGKLTALSKGGF